MKDGLYLIRYLIRYILNKEDLIENITKAHLDGVGRGEWGEAHILAHNANAHVCISRVCVSRMM